jgi:leucyl-tRNA synthetase
MQAKMQEKWASMNLFEVDAPAGGEPVPEGKFFGNFPYPYMNGVLHLGHAFSLSKLEFAAAYNRLIGKRVLFPQGFHCTGVNSAVASTTQMPVHMQSFCKAQRAL